MGLKIGVDLHGVIDANPEAFKAIAFLLMQTGNELYIISGPPIAQVEHELYKLGVAKDIHYTALYTIVNYLMSINANMWQDEKGTWWASEKNWWGSKARIAAHLELDMMIDNMAQYQPYFKGSKTKFILI